MCPQLVDRRADWVINMVARPANIKAMTTEQVKQTVSRSDARAKKQDKEMAELSNLVNQYVAFPIALRILLDKAKKKLVTDKRHPRESAKQKLASQSDLGLKPADLGFIFEPEAYTDSLLPEGITAANKCSKEEIEHAVLSFRFASPGRKRSIQRIFRFVYSHDPRPRP